ncbi:hypothetical protein SAMN00790413_00334 [Deinococcus hopiensis KR-140]|uniref:Uncharacterized protein n=1 Tax=Deinococcus hopiensis KR-140 TaxID=695939 RepID=A0A1W1V7J8_9DEIO|nr:hypothetical protein SAMN00790413_00334 [Deinococcus hopiensis KR-140]
MEVRAPSGGSCRPPSSVRSRICRKRSSASIRVSRPRQRARRAGDAASSIPPGRRPRRHLPQRPQPVLTPGQVVRQAPSCSRVASAQASVESGARASPPAQRPTRLEHLSKCRLLFERARHSPQCSGVGQHGPARCAGASRRADGGASRARVGPGATAHIQHRGGRGRQKAGGEFLHPNSSWLLPRLSRRCLRSCPVVTRNLVRGAG